MVKYMYINECLFPVTIPNDYESVFRDILAIIVISLSFNTMYVNFILFNDTHNKESKIKHLTV